MTKVTVNKSARQENDELAAVIRQRLAEHGVLTLNLVSSPGSGKTSLLERTVRDLSGELRLATIVGDVQTERDAERLREAGALLVQPITTGGLCHLDARMVTAALERLDPESLDILLIENVGNLVCPSSYDLGEDMKVVIISVTEGDDKPLKYPGMFRRSSLMVINKTDLLDHCDFEMDAVVTNARKVNGNIESLAVSCRSGEGLDSWYDWLRTQHERKRRKEPA
ncbi:hydrogenase nickel incorporation protein HypB [candidate division GN15 bacterium]|nr:hydrogenase nickel incorporation protein HypB [candidate division GN15 bacterium]